MIFQHIEFGIGVGALFVIYVTMPGEIFSRRKDLSMIFQKLANALEGSPYTMSSSAEAGLISEKTQITMRSNEERK